VTVPAAASIVTVGYQDRLIVVALGKAIGNQTYEESFTGPPHAPAHRSPMYR